MSSEHSARQTTVLKAGELLASTVTSAELAKLGVRIRSLVEELMHGLLDAIATASAVEIAELMGILEEERSREAARPLSREGRSEPSKRNGLARSQGRGPSPRVVAVRRVEENEHARPSFAPHSPFDITSPSDLLASVVMQTAQRVEERVVAATEAAVAALSSEPSREKASPAAAPSEVLPVARSSSESEAAAASERRPRVVLREGESLLSATGSGVVIRRERRIR